MCVVLTRISWRYLADNRSGLEGLDCPYLSDALLRMAGKLGSTLLLFLSM